jgi:hypothetical protein
MAFRELKYKLIASGFGIQKMRGDKWESHVLREMRNHLTLSKDSS